MENILDIVLDRWEVFYPCEELEGRGDIFSSEAERGGLVVKNPPASAGYVGLISG